MTMLWYGDLFLFVCVDVCVFVCAFQSICVPVFKYKKTSSEVKSDECYLKAIK